jgi:hypothetical protein
VPGTKRPAPDQLDPLELIEGSTPRDELVPGSPVLREGGLSAGATGAIGVVAEESRTVVVEVASKACPQCRQNRLVSGTSRPQFWQRVEAIR